MNGGAARAAYSLHRALLKNGVTSRMRVGRKQSNDPTVIQLSSRQFTMNSLLDRQLWRAQKSPRSAWRSPARFSTISALEINSSRADVVNLHWVTDGFISVEEIGKIEIPIVWSMYDMWPFSGTEHYGNLESRRWRDGYTRENRSVDDSRFDLDRWTFERKKKHWKALGAKIHMVAASRWLQDQTNQSYLMSEWATTKIPHVVDTVEFFPQPQVTSRSDLGIHTHAPLVAFLASAGVSDARKGWDLLSQALNHASRTFPDLLVVIAGPVPDHKVRQEVTSQTRAKFHWQGVINTNEQLRRIYSAADVVAVPSREDNMPLTAIEALACGTPVVGFNVGGISDVVTGSTIGYLARPGDVEDFSRGLLHVLSSRNSVDNYGKRTALWSSSSATSSYIELYQQVSRLNP